MLFLLFGSFALFYSCVLLLKGIDVEYRYAGDTEFQNIVFLDHMFLSAEAPPKYIILAFPGNCHFLQNLVGGEFEAAFDLFRLLGEEFSFLAKIEGILKVDVSLIHK